MSDGLKGIFSTFSKEELSKHNQKDDCWVSLNHRKVYDITGFVSNHPGGVPLLLKYGGKDVTQILAGGPKNRSHVHSNTAYEILEDGMFVGILVNASEQERLDDGDEDLASSFRNELPTFDLMTKDTDAKKDFERYRFLDIAEPLMPQIMSAHWTKDFYLDQVHRPRHCSKGARVYPNPIVDILCSRVPWWAILIYSPIGIASFIVGKRSLAELGALNDIYKWLLIGCLFWTFAEYILHRFIFHMDRYLPDYNQTLFALHFAIHGVHHFLPMDPERIAAPPPMVLLLNFLLWYVSYATMGPAYGNIFYAGGFASFLWYEEFHISLHTNPEFYQFWTGWWSHHTEMKRYHLQHHYKNYDWGYGVTSKLWDFPFGTVLDSADANQVHSK